MPLKLSRASFFGNSNRNYGKSNFTTTSSSDIILERENTTNNNNVNSLNTADINNTTVPLKPSQIIPLKRRSISMEVVTPSSSKNINTGSMRLGKENSMCPKSVWYKSIFGRLKWNTISTHQKSGKRSKPTKVSKAVSTSDKDSLQSLPSVLEKNDPSIITSQDDTTLVSSSPSSTTEDATAQTSQTISRNSSLFEIYAQTPRHNTSEAEVLGKVGRFTIVRERKDFNTSIFDQCHCAVKPCPYAESKSHPPAEAVVLSNYASRSLYRNSSSRSLPISIPSINSLSYNQKHHPNKKPSISVTSTNGPSKRHSAHMTNSYNMTQTTTVHPQSEKISALFAKSISVPVPSVPNITTTAPPTKSVHQEQLCHSASDSPSATKNETNSDVETNSTTTTNLQNAKPSRFIVHKLSSGSLNSDNSNAPTTQPTPTLSSHATINSHSGRKFEVEWLTDLTKVSPSSTISSIISYSTSVSAPSSSTSFTPSSSLSSHQGGSLSKSSTLSSNKGGRKFEVTVSERDTAVANYDV